MRYKDILGYERLYTINTEGIVAASNGKTRIPYKNHRGYLRINLSKNNKVKSFSVHRLVAAAFIDNPDNRPDVNHINGIRDDNRVINLEWCTQSENQIHAFNIGLQKGNMGSANGSSKLYESDIKHIRSICGVSHKFIAEIYGVGRRTIDRIIEKTIWVHI